MQQCCKNIFLCFDCGIVKPIYICVTKANKMKTKITDTQTIKPVIADNGVQFFQPCDVQEIGRMAADSFVNENKSLERRYTDSEVCDFYNISQDELNRIKQEYGVPNWL